MTPAELARAKEICESKIYYGPEAKDNAVEARTLLPKAIAEIERLNKEVDEQCRINAIGGDRELKLKEELVQERVRLAGCGVAALGCQPSGELKPGDYGHSASLDDVLKLRTEYQKLKRIIAKELTENDELGSEFVYVNALKEENQKLREALLYECYCTPSDLCDPCTTLKEIDEVMK